MSTKNTQVSKPKKTTKTKKKTTTTITTRSGVK